MLRIGICEDETAIRKEIHELAVKVLFQYEELDFYYYKNGQEVIHSIEKQQFFVELLLLDIHMPIIDGIQVADYIRKCNVDVDIIFVTISNQHVFQGYQYRAYITGEGFGNYGVYLDSEDGMVSRITVVHYSRYAG